MNEGAKKTALKLFGALADQAVLSAGSLLVSLILIRRADDHQYGYYVLATNAVLLLVTLQNAFFGAPLVNALTKLPEEQHGAYLRGLHRDQWRALCIAAALCGGIALFAWLSAFAGNATALVLAAFVPMALATLNREFFRMVQIARRRTYALLAADALFTACLLSGAWAATHSAAPAAVALLAMAAAAMLGGWSLRRSLKRSRLLDAPPLPGTLAKLAPIGAWAAAGGAIHWTFSQGYSYVVAGTLDLAAVAGIAAIRLLMMPLNLMSSGMSQLTMPTAARWLHELGPGVTFRRLLMISAAFLVMALAYFGVVWLLRHWIFGSLMHKTYAQADLLLLLWAAIFGVMVVRDQLIYLPVLAERFRELAGLALGCAVMALVISYAAMRTHGAPGALIGMLTGEIANLLGIVVFALREIRLGRTSPSLVANAA